MNKETKAGLLVKFLSPFPFSLLPWIGRGGGFPDAPGPDGDPVPADNILFAQEIYGAVKGVNPETGFNYDDTKRYIESIEWLSPGDREKIFHTNVRKVYSRYGAQAAGKRK